jgi:hypothetical protein
MTCREATILLTFTERDSRCNKHVKTPQLASLGSRRQCYSLPTLCVESLEVSLAASINLALICLVKSTPAKLHFRNVRIGSGTSCGRDAYCRQ